MLAGAFGSLSGGGSKSQRLDIMESWKMPYQSVFRPDLFKGQTIIVTGGGSGIGRCTAHELVALGANVAILGRTSEKLAEVKAEIEADGGRVLTQTCDIRY